LKCVSRYRGDYQQKSFSCWDQFPPRASVIVRRADSSQPNMGLTTWIGSRPRRTDVGIAKNHLTHQEIESSTS
jgi:hypothetical protein